MFQRQFVSELRRCEEMERQLSKCSLFVLSFAKSLHSSSLLFGNLVHGHKLKSVIHKHKMSESETRKKLQVQCIFLSVFVNSYYISELMCPN